MLTRIACSTRARAGAQSWGREDEVGNPAVYYFTLTASGREREVRYDIIRTHTTQPAIYTTPPTGASAEQYLRIRKQAHTGTSNLSSTKHPMHPLLLHLRIRTLSQTDPDIYQEHHPFDLYSTLWSRSRPPPAKPTHKPTEMSYSGSTSQHCRFGGDQSG